MALWRKVGVGSADTMFHLEAFQDLCRRTSVETDPAELEILKDALRIMLRFDGVSVEPAEKKLYIKPQ
jgi:hypothetical protein